MFERIDYIVVVDFLARIPFGVLVQETQYRVGDKLNLRAEGKMAKNWLEKGYIKEI